ncbi:MAG: helix-turn-helix domain-containing protein [Bacteroidaceae bacterium]|nr:helix-turn-helix domain-containing protein [Bacteroidaceae bacterium]
MHYLYHSRHLSGKLIKGLQAFLLLYPVILLLTTCSNSGEDALPAMQDECDTLCIAKSEMQAGECPMVHIEASRLSDLNIPRSAHSFFCVNGEVTVVGGHTTNFTPTATAEYYRDGKWHLMETAFPHDNGICVVLRSGKVIVGGGSEKPLGIGQTYPVEEYDPGAHTFRAFSCLDTKRALASALEIDSGRVVVAGNWYAGDSIELFDSDRYFHFVKEVSVQRASTYILRIAPDDVLILGNGGTHGEPLMSDVVDRLKGEPLHVPLLRRWQPLFYGASFCSDTGFIGDEDRGDYSWLLPVQDWQEGDSTAWDLHRQLAFLLMRDTTFALLPTTCPVPKKGPYGEILYYSPVIADRKAHRGYVHGIDKDNRHYIVCVEYDQRPAPLTLYYTDPLPDAGWPQILLTDEGDLMITGGINYNHRIGGTLGNDNYSPLNSVFLLHTSQNDQARSQTDRRTWGWIVLIAAVLLATLYIIILLRRNRKAAYLSKAEEPDAGVVLNGTETTNESEELMQRISMLLEQEQLYLDSNLKLADLANRLGTNRNMVSACINSKWSCSFSQLMNSYRVRHAQVLMSQQADIKMTEVWMDSGFATESSFFRAFKATTGMTPKEWREQETTCK